jgi:hypothetical protein
MKARSEVLQQPMNNHPLPDQNIEATFMIYGKLGREQKKPTKPKFDMGFCIWDFV